MRNIWRIFRDDLRLATSNIVAVLVVLGLCLVPVMYAWFNIAGSWDPYGHTDRLKIAVANDDEGYESALIPVELNIGDRVENMLHGNDDYGWTFVDSDEALDGVRSGKYYAAIVIPADFSAKMMSFLSADAERANVDFYLNMKENPIAPVLAGEGGAEAVEDIRLKFTEAVDEMTLGLASGLITFAGSDGAKDFGERLVTRLGDVADALDVAAGQARMLTELTDATASLTSATAHTLSNSGFVAESADGTLGGVADALDSAIDDASAAASDIEKQVKAASSSSGLDGVGTDAASKLADDIASLASSVDALVNRADKATGSLQEAVASLAESTDATAGGLAGVRDELGASANKLSASASKIRKFQDDVASAISRGSITTVASIVGDNTAGLAQWLAEPVELERHEVFPVENYGSSMAPFYTILSIWVGCVILVAMMKTGVSESRLRRYVEQRDGRAVRNYEQYLGRYGIFLLLSLAQATVVGLGDLFFLGIQCDRPLLFLAACWACALVFSSIVYTLAVSFGEIGKALCIIMLVMQVAGAGGEYPVQMMGDFFQAVYPFMPFTYGMRAMQEAIAGPYGMEYAWDLLKLAAFFVPSLLLGLALRRPLIRAAAAFGRKLEESGVM